MTQITPTTGSLLGATRLTIHGEGNICYTCYLVHTYKTFCMANIFWLNTDASRLKQMGNNYAVNVISSFEIVCGFYIHSMEQSKLNQFDQGTYILSAISL